MECGLYAMERMELTLLPDICEYPLLNQFPLDQAKPAAT